MAVYETVHLERSRKRTVTVANVAEQLAGELADSRNRCDQLEREAPRARLERPVLEANASGRRRVTRES